MSQRKWSQIEVAGRSDSGRKRLSNEDAWFADPYLGMFVVSDGMGGRPSGEAASELVAHGFSHVVKRALRQQHNIRADQVPNVISDAAVQMSQSLRQQIEGIEPLRGMGATLVAAIVDRGVLLTLAMGDSRAYLLHNGELTQLTEDGVAVRRTETGRTKRYLVQFVGCANCQSPAVRRNVLEKGDRILLCTDGLTDVVEDAAIASCLAQFENPDEAVTRLINLANGNGGPDNITALVIDYQGLTHSPCAAPPEPANEHRPAAPLIEQVHQQLNAVHQSLHDLWDGAVQTGQRQGVSAMAEVKRRLGPKVFKQYLELHPSSNALHVYHRASTLEESPWRELYDQRRLELEASLDQLIQGRIRLSPLLPAQKTGAILQRIWRSWRQVEARYFQTCQRDAVSENERTLHLLIEHMVDAVATMQGLLQLLPIYFRKD